MQFLFCFPPPSWLELRVGTSVLYQVYVCVGGGRLHYDELNYSNKSDVIL